MTLTSSPGDDAPESRKSFIAIAVLVTALVAIIAFALGSYFGPSLGLNRPKPEVITVTVPAPAPASPSAPPTTVAPAPSASSQPSPGPSSSEPPEPSASPKPSTSPAAGGPTPGASGPSQINIDGCEVLEDMLSKEACAGYVTAATKRVEYYNGVRHPDDAQVTKAEAALSSAYRGGAWNGITRVIEDQWGPDRRDGVVAHATVSIGGSEIVGASAGVIKLTTVETWIIATEGGPLPPTEDENAVEHTITMTRNPGTTTWMVTNIE